MHARMRQQQGAAAKIDLTDLAQSVDAEIIYSVGPHYTNTATDSEHADTVLFSAYAVLRESGYSGPVVIDVAALDAYVRAAVISQQLPGMLCIKRKQEKIYCRGLVADKMPDCIVQLHYDANSGFYGKGKKSVYYQVANSSVSRRAPRELSSRHRALRYLVIYRLLTVNQHCHRAKLLGVSNVPPSLKHHPSPLGHGWELVGGRCRPVRHMRPALPMHQGKLKRAGKMTARRRMRKMMIYKGGGGFI